MNLLLFEPGELGAGRILRLAEERGRHLREVQQVQPGCRLRVGELGGGLGDAEVVEVATEEVVLRVGELLPAAQQPEISLILGLPRPQSLKKVLETVAAYGVRRLLLCGSQRVQKSYFSSKVLRPEELRRHLVLGLEQGIGTFMPEVAVERSLGNVQLDDQPRCRLLATPGSERGIEELNLHQSLRGQTPLVLAVGPEGGWTEREVKWFIERGFSAFHIGNRVLRVETAVCSLLAQLLLLQRMGAAFQK